MILQRGIEFMIKQGPGIPRDMRENLDFHKAELKLYEKEAEIARLSSEPGAKGSKFKQEFAEAFKREVNLVKTNDSEQRALAMGLHALNPGSNTMEIGGPESQRLFDSFIAPPPSANRDQSVDPCSCTFCKKLSKSKLPSCARCKKQAYCSRDCQKKHWKGHKRYCVEVHKLEKEDRAKIPLTWGAARGIRHS